MEEEAPAAAEEASVTEEQPLVEEQPAPAEEEKKEPVSEKPVTVASQAEAPDEEEPARSKLWLWLLACALCFAAGYFLGNKTGGGDNRETAVDLPVAVAQTDTLVKDTLVKDTLAKDTLAADSVVKKVQAEPETDEDAIAQKYDAMDNRVRLGAYRIVGTDRVITVKPGETLSKITRRILGPDMECYIEVYNDIKKADQLEVGQELKIPKLKLKKPFNKKKKE